MYSSSKNKFLLSNLLSLTKPNSLLLNPLSSSFSFNKTQQKTFAVNEKALKARIKSVSSIAKITKAMKMVSSSKMRLDLQRLNSGRHFGHETIDKLLKSDSIMQKKIDATSQGLNKVLFVPFTSDRGLCGGINSSIVREIRNTLKNSGSNVNNSGLYVIGDKGISALSRAYGGIIKRGVHDIQTPMNFATASSIAHDIVAKSEGMDKIVLVYNYYKSAISYLITKTEIIPRERFIGYIMYGKSYFMKNPDKKSCAPALHDLYVASNFYHAILNNLASEQSARMSAMENASKNAKEIVEKLLLEYNKARQARITMELVEIISGASAV